MRPAYLELLKGLSAQLRAGVPLKEALAVISTGGRAARLARDVLEALETADRSLGDALGAACPAVPPEHRALLDAGVESGRLAEVLASVIQDAETIGAMRSALVTRLSYPVVVLALAFLLPPLVLVVTGRTWEYIRLECMLFAPFVGLALLWMGGRRLLPRHSAVRGGLERILFSIPFLGRALAEAALARALSVLGLLLGSGLGFADSLPLVAKASRWQWLDAALHDADRRIRNGATGAAGLVAVPHLPFEFRSRLAAGEAAGALDDVLGEAGSELRARTITRIERFVRLAPVAATLAGGLVVLWIALDAFGRLYGV